MQSQVGLRSISMNKARGGDGIPVKLFQILKDYAVKVLHSICQHIWKTPQWPQDWKGKFSFQSQRKAMTKNAQTTTQLHSSHTLVRVRVRVKSFSCVPTLCNPMDCSLPGFSVHEIFQARVLEWVAFPSPGDLPDPRDRIQVSTYLQNLNSSLQEDFYILT